jgi:hypothetical protein
VVANRYESPSGNRNGRDFLADPTTEFVYPTNVCIATSPKDEYNGYNACSHDIA